MNITVSTTDGLNPCRRISSERFLPRHFKKIQIKMKWLLCLAILLCLTSFSDACERELVKKCTKSYVTLLDKKPDEGSHCTRLKEVFGCFWSNRDCKGQNIRRWRGWVLMIATLEKFLDICPRDDQQLQKFYEYLPDDSKPRRIYERLKAKPISAKDKQCATQIHKSCKKQFVELVRKNHRICDDGGYWLKCYGESGCDKESAIVRYAKFVAELAPKLVSDCKRSEL
ncbi:uncharacterized protein LOC113674748 [Pocillopora damicornis]|uniref:uncharacterized protein LOC113674748 n=1 Tax=Pocillopora damicornis TaxID=46731 RepID=UPI000F5537F0|nr:uncharacterized protein LOC113674748 [Pocillopora damicornis]